MRKKRNAQLFLILVLLSCIACKNVNQDSLEDLNIYAMLQQKEEVVSLDNYFDRIELIPLETRSDILVSGILWFEADSRFFYLSDNFNNLFIFDADSGRFHAKISMHGKGPGEFIEISDFSVSSDGKTVAIGDMSQHKILLFTTEGNFIKEFKTENNAMSLSFIDDSNLIFYSPSQLSRSKTPTLSFANINSGKIYKIREFSSVSVLKSPYIMPCNFNKLNDHLLVKIPFIDTIYAVDHMNIYPKYNLTFSNKDIPTTVFESTEEYRNKASVYIAWGGFWESSDLFLFTVSHENKLKRGIINKTTGRARLVKSAKSQRPGFTNQLLDERLIWPDYQCNNVFYSYIDDLSLLSEHTRMKFKDKTINDNPIIIKMIKN
ncbi:6-bladed beta-propeller [Saccharicrinis sp. FJH2]|uniref:6-bladed beta-propeller n=1 Tax=Saccharicrinis sp. FJH65 TaxID=3344659 RepID=UPI0035F451EA